MNIDPKKAGSKGGKARAKALTPEQRQEIARYAVESRWEKGGTRQSMPKATHSGKMVLSDDLVLDCAVLDDPEHTRVLSERGVAKALLTKRGGAGWKRKKAAEVGSKLPVYISATNLTPYLSASLQVALSQPIQYRAKNGQIGNGVLATLIPEICEVWLKARRAEALLPGQEHIARTAEVLLAGLASVGIVALVDEATGYQAVRDRDELHQILEAYVAKELLPWSKRFPSEFYEELFRLRGWSYSPISVKRPKLVGKLTSEIVYEKLPRGVLDELRRKNPVVKDGWRRHKHHQFLTEDIGNPHLEKYLAAVIALMRASPSWGRFNRLLERAFPGEGTQWELPGLDQE